ncbi:MAG TPA: hypothetical protein VH370_26795 [Humisphaera sp.]|jgi:hypothetical protein|nr:hypothetical protein [Humisphaera sp.]
MRHRLHALLPAISFLICIGVAVLWRHSYRAYECLAYGLAQSNCVLWSQDGELILYATRFAPLEKGLSFARGATSASYTFNKDRKATLGVRAGRPNESDWFVSVADAWVVGVAAILPVAWFYRFVRARLRKRAGRCLSCGYDLTGNQSGVCPECGTKLQVSS